MKGEPKMASKGFLQPHPSHPVESSANRLTWLCRAIPVGVLEVISRFHRVSESERKKSGDGKNASFEPVLTYPPISADYDVA